jgi:hypothetical protein
MRLAVRLIDLACAVFAIEFVAFARSGKHTGSHEQHREKFHRAP